MELYKVVRIGTIPINNRHGSVYCKITFKDKRLSISGVIAPLPSGNALGGCGQIDMEFDHANKKQNGKRYDNPIKASSFKFAKGWNPHIWYKFLSIWKDYHLSVEVPQEVIDFLNSLPETDKKPAWV